MDVFVAKKIIEKFEDAKAAATAPSQKVGVAQIVSQTTELKQKVFVKWSLWYVLSLCLFGIPAGILSWYANGKLGYNILLKIVFSVLCFIAGLPYLIAFVIYRADAILYVMYNCAKSAM
jgi:hypothetical protein